MSDITHSSDLEQKDIIFATPRTYLRGLRETDVEKLHERVFSVPDVMKWVFSGKIFTRCESDAFVSENFSSAPSPIGLSVLTDNATGDVLGFAGLNRCRALSADDLEIGFVLAREAWGRGLATEIGQAQLDCGFLRLGCERLLALAARQNGGSIHALKKLGMRYHGDVDPTDRATRHVFYMNRSDWLAPKAE